MVFGAHVFDDAVLVELDRAESDFVLFLEIHESGFHPVFLFEVVFLDLVCPA
jgi:hypothetical protein